jgi:hypothetical protein
MAAESTRARLGKFEMVVRHSYHLYKIAGHNKFIRVNWMSEKTTFQARKA